MYVVESNGSSPGRQGFAMAVNAKGEMQGSIGGGIMEHKFVEMCRDLLSAEILALPFTRKQFHDKESSRDQSGMICSGDQTIFIYPVKDDDFKVVNDVLECVKNHADGTLEITNNHLNFIHATTGEDFFYKILNENEFIFKEKVGYKNSISIIGGGHCSLALSKLMQDLDFFVEVYDCREGLNTMKDNVYAHAKHMLQGYEELEGLNQPGKNLYVVVMTFGYRTDDIAIRALMKKEFKYFGVLGSEAKMRKLFSGYIAEGFDKSQLDKIHAPIGLPINSRTPGEIAVSIAAEIILVKNRN